MFERLIEQGLVKEKKYDNGLSVFKYTRKVFYDALWNTDELLLEARGMVIDTKTGEKVIWPFIKVFNYTENGAGEDLSQSTSVEAIRKVNGFMAACRLWNGELVVSTTGTLDSEFAEIARKHIEKLEGVATLATTATLIFEICDHTDPHIVAEEEGAYLIGARNMSNGGMFSEALLDYMGELIGAKRPQRMMIRFDALEELVSLVKHEGFMVRDIETGETLFKWKSPHYLAKKFLMRMGDKKVDFMYDNFDTFKETLDEEFYEICEWIVTEHERDIWKSLGDQERRSRIEGYFNG